MRTFAIGTICTLLLSASFTRAADDAAAIVDKAIKAHGADEHYGKYKAGQWKVKGIMNFMDMKMDYTADYTFQRPGEFRFDMEATFGGQKIAITAASNGKIAWEKGFGKVQNMPKKKAEAFLHSVYCMHLSSLMPLKEKEYTLSAGGEENVDGKPALGVLVTRKGHPDISFFFDKESSLLVKFQTKTWDEFTNKDATQEAFFKDYKKKDGHLYFHKMIVKRDGKDLLEEEFSDQKSIEKLDAKLFAKP